MKVLLILLLSFTGLTAIIFGLELILFPDGSAAGLPLSILQHTPFSDFIIPGIILAFIVGGSNLLAAFYLLGRRSNKYKWSFSAGLILCGWIVAQMLLIREVNGLQVFYIVLGIAIVATSHMQQLKFSH